MTEDKCRELVDKICSTLNWKVEQYPNMPRVLLISKGKLCAYGYSWLGLFNSIATIGFGRCSPFSDDFPEWMKECSSCEELAVKIDLHCG